MNAAPRRIPSLDGLRAVSILLVLFAHASGTAGFAGWRGAGALAVVGVRVFFVISGFLITSLLLKEETRTGTISLGHFYLRRTLRIFPPFYLFIGVIAAAAALRWITLERDDVLAAVTYTTNYHHHRSWWLGQTWSLAVEEQFYLLWPFVMKALGRRRAAQTALAAVILAPLLRVGLMAFAPSFRAGIGETFPTVVDALATGCLLACWRDRLDASPRLLAFLRGPLFWVVPAVAIAAAFTPSAKLGCLLGETITNIGVALMIDRFVRWPVTITGRLLNARPVALLGVLSYSLYLWQQPFLNRRSSLWISSFPVNLLLALAAATASYLLIERPSLRLRAWIDRRLREPSPKLQVATTPVALPPW